MDGVSGMVAAAGPDKSGRSARRLMRQMSGSRTLRVLIVRGLGLVALFGFEVVAARSLGVAGYGIFSVALAVAVIVSRLAPLGWLNASTRLVSDYVHSARLGLLKGSLFAAHGATALGILAAAVLLGLAALLHDGGSAGEGFGAGLPALRILLPLAAALSLLELHRHILRGLHSGDLGEALLVLLLPGLAMAAIWAFGIAVPQGALSAYLAVCLALLCASSVAIARRLPSGVWTARAAFRNQGWTLAALAMLVGSASDELTARLAVIVLGALGSETEAGLYQAAARLALLNVFVLRALTPVAAPRITVLYQDGRGRELRSAFRRLCLMALLGALPIFVVLAVFPGRILSLFGAEFAEADTILRVLSVGYLASAATGPCATALMMIGRERIYGAIAFSTLLVNIAATALLARHFGALGAAVATSAILVINNVLYLTILFRAIRPVNGAAVSPSA